MMDGVETKNINLRSLSKDGYIGFSIKTKDTEDNAKVHKDFLSFCYRECGDNYTLGLKVLLSTYDSAEVFRVLYEELAVVKDELASVYKELEGLKAEAVAPKKIESDEKGGVF
jgi:hypothetical protein